MIRHLAFAITAFACFTSVSQATDWSDIAFPVKTHDFGTVAVGAKTEFPFSVVNTMSSGIHIQSVRASCGCTTPIVVDQYVAPGATGTILARFNTSTFKGKKGATLTVVIDQPFYSEVRLRVDGYIRSDMVFYPGSIDFGKIAQGEATSKSTKVLYAGRSDWQIVDIRSNKPWLMPVIKETVREGGRVNYELSVDLREDAPTGSFLDELVVVTNDRSMPNVPLKVSGQVDSALSISPQAIAFGSIKTGEAFTKSLVLMGREPFQVESITAEGWQIDFQPTTELKKMQMVSATFKYVGNGSGPQKASFEIKTSGANSVTAKGLVTADIRVQ
ncbi:hypothetical protein Poly51_03050 [Rubripirellula tenax]|uniref:DUF1573 domain-containing protein n=1 Tax=Rubripirellula tenax TaxID=2528015 RepID=A0A5C6FEU7_9BACT|nr:DUF1573 domain-containing protein [Rubripirellula tenax]TWU60031.1 hypothetical protein Poly51_03050 [Rubripirellula tenax]